MNQLPNSQANSAPSVSMPSQPVQSLIAMATHPPPVSTVTGSSSTTVTELSLGSTQKSGEVQPLTNVFVPLESIKPGEQKDLLKFH